MSGSWMRSGLLLRLLIAASPVVAVGCARAAGDRSLFATDVDSVGIWVIIVELLIVTFALVCTAHPDSHFGAMVVVLVGIEWLAIVDQPTTPWALGAAASIAVFHMALAASSVAPLRARWTKAMQVRWTKRFVVLAATALPTWLAVVLLDSFELAGSRVLLGAALLILAAAGLWVRHGGFERVAS